MATSSAYVTCSAGGNTYTYHFTGVSLQKVPDRTYDRTGTNVTYPSDMKPADSYDITALMTQIPGWHKAEKSVRLPLYGRQRGYERIPDVPVFLE